MAETDRARFNRVLNEAEAAMDAMFADMARELGALVMRSAGQDGTVPVEQLIQVQRQARAIVDRYFVQGQSGGFDEEGRPLTPYARIIADGQNAMIDIAFEREAAIYRDKLPEDVRRLLVREWMVGGNAL